MYMSCSLLWLFRKYICLSKCNFIQIRVHWEICRATRSQFLIDEVCFAGRKKARRQLSSPEAICNEPATKLAGLLGTVASNKSHFLLITSGSMTNGLNKVMFKKVHFGLFFFFPFLLFSLSSFSPFLLSLLKLLEYIYIYIYILLLQNSWL